ncbi:MAG: ABC transporter ATP-binding protein [Acidobacteriota bacterium]|jgi:lipopolysaccharide transport system ATP-binding protein
MTEISTNRTIIKVENLGKLYQIGAQRAQPTTLRDALSNLWRRGERSSGGEPEDLWALRDINFEVRVGEIVGIVGKNGAGKSTLLKILSRITRPTTGQVDIYGRVGSLLEVGTGFNPELSGRENVYLNGAILGMRRREIERKFDEIVDFAEVRKFIDTPVKHYSSGMYMRLAFGVAAHLEPEILVVDEVLAVGDFSFQKKCIGKMSSVAREGRTVLFVSHNLVALRSLCTRAIWLDRGKLVMAGEVNEVINQYLQQENSSRLEKIWTQGDSSSSSSDVPAEISVVSARLLPQTVDVKNRITVRDALRLEFEYINRIPDNLLQVSFVLYNLEGICLFNGRSTPQRFPAGLIRQSCLIPGSLLNDDSYTVRLVIVRDTNVGLFDEFNVLSFDVHDIERDGGWFGKWIGVIRPEFEWAEPSVEPLAAGREGVENRDLTR